MRLQLCAIMPMCLLLGADNPRDDAGVKDMVRFQGTWLVISVTGASDGVPGAEPNARWIFEGERCMHRSKAGRESPALVYRLDSSRNPKTIDLGVTRMRNIDGKFAAFEGIYELSGDVLRICLSALDRPTEFKANAAVRIDGDVIIVLERTKR